MLLCSCVPSALRCLCLAGLRAHPRWGICIDPIRSLLPQELVKSYPTCFHSLQAHCLGLPTLMGGLYCSRYCLQVASCQGFGLSPRLWTGGAIYLFPGSFCFTARHPSPANSWQGTCNRPLRMPAGSESSRLLNGSVAVG